MSQKLKELNELIYELKTVLGLEKEKQIKIEINETIDTIIISAKPKNKDGEVFISLPK